FAVSLHVGPGEHLLAAKRPERGLGEDIAYASDALAQVAKVRVGGEEVLVDAREVKRIGRAQPDRAAAIGPQQHRAKRHEVRPGTAEWRQPGARRGIGGPK